MVNPISIDQALAVPSPDILALSQGRMSVIITHIDMYSGRAFALYPVNSLLAPLSPENYYKSSFLSKAQPVFSEKNPDLVEVKFWGKCQHCFQLTHPEDLTKLSKLTIWVEDTLKTILQQKQCIFLTALRVYRFHQPIIMSSITDARFIPLPQSITVTETYPILDEENFHRQYAKIKNLEPPNHPELEALDDKISQLMLPESQFLQDHIEIFLGWKSPQLPEISPELNWINDINKLGNRSQEEDTGKSNYQAGTDFENIVKKSLEFLGFTIDYAHKGGAGGLDLFCSQPYPLVGECKAGKKIPNNTAVQLLNLGTLRLKDENLLKQVTKLIIGPGDPTQQLIDAAKVHHIAIINPMTLEKLVKLQTKYPGSVDLIELKKYLQAGQTDEKIQEYIDQIMKKLKLRSHVIQVLKKFPNPKEIAYLKGSYDSSNPTQWLTEKEFQEILIELSSPLAGYLGRIKDDKTEQFYFLRDLIVDDEIGDQTD